MTNFTVPTKEEVSEKNKGLFEALESKIGFVPNVYAITALSENGLENYLNFSQGQGSGSLSAREREVVSLAVSQVNGCRYCQSAHTALAKMNGFTDEEAVDLRKGKSEDTKIDALVKLAKEITVSRGRPSEEALQTFFDAGYTKEGLIDVVLVVADTTYTNFINNITQIPIDFPVAPDLSEEVAA